VRFALLALLAVLLLAGCGGGERLAGASAPDVLTGYLRYAGGPSSSGPVKVAVYRHGARVATQTASDSGRFRFKLTRGTYELRANTGEAKCELEVSVHAPTVHANLPCLGPVT
jgi:hypothetical protein